MYMHIHKALAHSLDVFDFLSFDLSLVARKRGLV